MVRTLLLSLALGSVVLADEVVLRNGSAFSGIVREEGDKVVVEMDFGTMTFKKQDVRSITRGEDPIREYEEKAKTATTVKSMLELASWAREKGLAGRANDLFRKIIGIDPDQEQARKALGFEKINGQWLTGDDLMTARGFVKVNGRWMDRGTADRIMELEAQGRVEADRLALEERMADQRHAEELTRLALERERLEIDKTKNDPWGWRTSGYLSPLPWGGGVGFLLPSLLTPSQQVPLTQPSLVPLGPPSSVPAARFR